MKMWNSFGAWALVGAVAFGAGNSGAEIHPWASWAPGTWVETEIVPFDSGKMLNRETLMGAGPDGVQIARVTTMSGPGGPVDVDTQMTLGLATMGSAHLDPGRKNLGNEKRVALGRRFDCTVWRAAGSLDGKVSQETTWMTAELDYPVRIETKFGPWELSLDLVQLEDSIRVGNKKVSGARYEGTAASADREDRVFQVRSAEVPGGLVRTEMRRKLENGSFSVHSNTVVAFETP